jgi:hypothetical protein
MLQIAMASSQAFYLLPSDKTSPPKKNPNHKKDSMGLSPCISNLIY